MAETRLDTAKIVNAQLPRMPIWRSSVLWGILLAVIGPLLKQFGIIANWDDAAANELADLIVNGVTGAGGLLALYGRLTQKAAPPLKIV